MDWVKAFSEVSKDDLAAVEVRIADIKSELAVLNTVRYAMESRLGVKREPSDSSRSHKKKPMPGTVVLGGGDGLVGPATRGNTVEGHRQRAAKFLLDAETPIKAPQIAMACNIPIGSMTHVVNSSWFTNTETGYVLTRLGQTEARLLG